MVLPLSMMDNSVFSPNRLTIPINPVYLSLLILPCSSFHVARNLMPQHLCLLLLLFFLILSLSWLWHLSLPHHCPPHSSTVTLHTAVQRLLKPRSPRDCPAWCLASTLSSGVEPAVLATLRHPFAKSIGFYQQTSQVASTMGMLRKTYLASPAAT